MRGPRSRKRLRDATGSTILFLERSTGSTVRSGRFSPYVESGAIT
jgi:hypothetical protein